MALYLEEHEPSLQATLLSAVESSRNGDRRESAALVRKVVEQAIEACVRMDAARRADQAPLKQVGVGAGRRGRRRACSSSWSDRRSCATRPRRCSSCPESIEAAVPYRLEVKPGNTEVPKGADQAVKVKLFGFAAKTSSSSAANAAPTTALGRDSARAQRGRDLRRDALRRAGAARVLGRCRRREVRRSYSLTVVDVPTCRSSTSSTTIPSYTGLEVEKIEDGGDIAVLRGTEVRVHITPTMKTPGGQIADQRQADACR